MITFIVYRIAKNFIAVKKELSVFLINQGLLFCRYGTVNGFFSMFIFPIPWVNSGSNVMKVSQS